MGVSRRAVTTGSFQFRIVVIGAALSSTAVSIETAAHPETGCHAAVKFREPRRHGEGGREEPLAMKREFSRSLRSCVMVPKSLGAQTLVSSALFVFRSTTLAVTVRIQKYAPVAQPG